LPDGWTADEETGDPSIVARLDTQVPDLTAQAFVFYSAERLNATEVAQQWLALLAGLAGFRTVSETPFTLPDGTDAYEALYGFGIGSDEQRGALVFAVRGTQTIVIQVVGPRLVYERSFDAIDQLFRSLRIEAPMPFGIPRDQALTLALDSGPFSMDPAVAQESQSIQYIRQVFGGLTALDADLKAVPDLATWEVSPDGRTYTFHLRPNARFHDGRPVTAQDVVYSWERAMDPDLGSGVANTYLSDIMGMADVRAGTVEHASGLVVVNDGTLQVTIDAPKSYFLAKLTHSSAFIVDRQEIEADPDNWWKQPNGTGLFLMQEWDEGRAMHLRRNPTYHGTPPQVEHVVFRLYVGGETGAIPMRLFEDGETDAALLGLGELRILQLEESPLLQEVVERSQLSIQYIGFNTGVPPFNDPQVRRAFLHAVDRQALVAGDLEGIGTVAQGFIPPGLPGYDPNVPAIPYLGTAAQTELLASAYPNAEALPDIVLSLAGGVGTHHEQIAQMWRDNLGVTISAEVLPSDTYYYGDLSANVANLYDYGWIADYPDPHNFLYDLFHSGSENNVGKFSDPEVDALLERAQTEPDQAARMGLYRQAEQLLVARAAAIPLWHSKERYIVQDGLRGFIVNQQGHMDLRGVSLGAEE
jgi:ABC-type transport system substrate-binding protein